MRTTYDIEMLRQVGSCSGIENYSRHIDGREAGTPPNTLLDYFPEDFLLVIDESHVTVPQIGAMYEGDVSRKRVLVEHGFRLPSAIDNRPLTWEEFLRADRPDRLPVGHPGPVRAAARRRRRGRAGDPADRAGRPRGDHQADQGADRRPAARDQAAGRARRAGAGHHADQADGRGPDRLPAGELGVRARYLHSEVDTLRRVELLRELRVGRVRRAGRHQPAPRGPRPARGVAGGHPGRGQGRLPAFGHVADPDHRPRGQERVRRGPHVRRHGHAVDAAGDRRDQPAAGQAGRLQHEPTASTRSRCASGSPTSWTSSSGRTPTPSS